MFIGHFAAGLAVKRLAPGTSLGLLIGACEFIDLVWPAFVLAGWERVRIDPGNTAFTPLDFTYYPWTHSLLMTGVWAAAVSLVYWQLTRYAAGSIVLGAVVLSHWFLDALSHRPDLPLYPGGPRVGLGLWNSVPATLVVEGLMFIAGVWIYARSTKPRDRIGRYGLWLFVLALAAMYVGDAAGPPPPSVRAIGLVGLAAWLLPVWAWRFDRHRAPLASLRA